MSLLEMRNIEKSFNTVKVLNNIRFSLEQGTVHALMGENGAGKSTMMKILAGIYKSDGGEIAIDGKKVSIESPQDSQNLGIAMIHQELSSIPQMTVAENIFLAREPGSRYFMDYNEMYRKTGELLKKLDVYINPKAKIGTLKVADQQMIEIAKAVSFDAKIIVMDEPTSAIADKEADNLFRIIDSLKKQGKGIIYISHKMDEIFRIADEITVLRDGTYINSWKAKDINNDILIKNMVGRELKDIFPKVKVPIGETLLEVKNFSLKNKFSNINFKVRKGEIVGFAGLVGAGRTEVMNSLFGLIPPDTGEIYMEGKHLNIKKPEDAIHNGISYVTEDRKNEGLVLQMGVGKNISLASMKQLSKGFFIKLKEEKQIIEKQIKALRIKVYSSRQLVSFLSGGNQQKVVLAKWMMKNPKLLILDEPTRGIDVGAKSEIYKLMCEYVSKGNSIIMISSEMSEVMGMSDRIIVLSNGALGGELYREEFEQEKIMSYAVSNL